MCLKKPVKPVEKKDYSIIARDAYEKAMLLEPKLTHFMSTLANMFNGTLVDLKFAVKSKDSIVRKLETTKDIANITDINRYTIIFPPEEYVDSV